MARLTGSSYSITVEARGTGLSTGRSSVDKEEILNAGFAGLGGPLAGRTAFTGVTYPGN